MMESKKNIIGIVGGMGPVAGVDLASKVISETASSSDQGHLPMVLYSFPGMISDRTAYILNHHQADSKKNPGNAIAEILLKMEQAGVTVAGMACNSAHSPIIFNRITEELKKNQSKVHLLHMVREVGSYIRANHHKIRRVGIVGTTGTRASKLYHLLEDYGCEVIEVTDEEQERLQSAIYNPEYGIKSTPNGKSVKAVKILSDVSQTLIERGAELVVLGCTEFSVVYQDTALHNLPLIDPALILARALVRECM